jgi:multidrug resistance protein
VKIFSLFADVVSRSTYTPWVLKESSFPHRTYLSQLSLTSQSTLSVVELDAQGKVWQYASNLVAMAAKRNDPYISSSETIHISLDKQEKMDIAGSQTTDITDIEKGLRLTEAQEKVASRSRADSEHTEVGQGDDNLVDWEGELDPEDPRNWKRRRKWIAIVLVSAFTFITPVASSILAPSLSSIAADLQISSESEKSLCLSIFVLGFAFGPLVLGPLSELYGRAIVLQLSNLLFIIFNCACGFARTKEQLIVFRLIAGLGGSSPLALGSGVLADLFIPDERGAAVGIYSFFPILGPAIGPLCGGFIEEYSSWRWAFWATTIADIPILVFGSVLLEETYGPLLLKRKKERLVKETGNHALHTRFEVPWQTVAMEMKVALTRPLILIGTQPIIMVMGLYQAYLYGLMYVVLTTYPPLWKTIYHQSVSISGLNYISLGLGYCVGIQVRNSVRLCKSSLN